MLPVSGNAVVSYQSSIVSQRPEQVLSESVCLYGTSTQRPTANQDLLGTFFYDTTNQLLYQCQKEQGGTTQWRQLIAAVTASTYVPTITGVTNLASSTAVTSMYQRVGSMVSVSGKVQLTATTTASVVLGISLPISTTFTVVSDAAGVGTTISDSVAVVAADVANARAEMTWIAPNSTFSHDVAFNFSYKVA